MKQASLFVTNRTLGSRSLLVVVLVACLLPAVNGWAATASIGGFANGLGVLAGLVLVGLVLYCLWVYSRPLLSAGDSGPGWALLLLAGLAVLKFATLPVFPGLGIDVGSYQAWALRMADGGPARMYQPGYFLDYPPGYLYALWAAGAFVRELGISGDLVRWIIETPALIGDLVLGWLIFVIVRRRLPAMAWLGLILFALNPALLFDTVVWGQSDSVFTLMMLLSTVLAIDGEFELSWGMAALAVLTKPQALALLPILGCWTLMRARPATWGTSALGFVAVGVIGAAPFQSGRPWSWLVSLYGSTAAYYHETSVNAFNFMGLIGGLRQADANRVAGLSYFTIGMGLLALMYLGLAFLLWRRRSAENMLAICFLTVFGFFMFAPRMHERYLYPALVFAVPMAVESGWMLAVLAVISATFLLNLADVKSALEHNYFFPLHDPLAMFVAVLNTAALGAAAYWSWMAATAEKAAPGMPAFWQQAQAALGSRLRAGQRVAQASKVPVREERQCPPWLRLDSCIVLLLVVAAAALHFWHLGRPNEIVFDEVHFVGQARHYLHGEQFLDPHPPLAKLLIALGIWLFGDHAWAWRLGNATVGTALVAITYLLGRRMFNSRMTGALAAMFVLCDGMFIVDSRIAVVDIVYLTFAAWSYLLLFRFIQTPDPRARRRTLLAMAVTLGLCLGSKLYVPAITYLLVIGFMTYVLLSEGRSSAGSAPARGRASAAARTPAQIAREKRVSGAIAMVTAVAAIFYIGTFLPHYLLGWWGGIADLFKYYKDVIWYENSVASATHPYAAPWWSWPLMLRPIAYWQNFPPVGDVATIWGGGNPASWWGALTAILIVGMQALERRSLPRAFLAIGFLSYLLMWVPIGRTLFLYHYMPAVYLGYLALAATLTECWEGKLLVLEKVALLLTLMPPLLLGIGGAAGAIAALALLAGYAALLGRGQWEGRFVCVVFVGVIALCFIYFLPLWLGIPVSRSGYYARMWLQGPGLRNWI